MRNGPAFKRYLQPKIKAAGFTDERFAVERMKRTKAAISGWWKTGKISKEHLEKISRMPDIGAPLHELFAALRGEDPTAAHPKQWQPYSDLLQTFHDNVKRMSGFVFPNVEAAAAKKGISPEVLTDPSTHLAEPTLLDVDLVAQALNTKAWVLLHPHSKQLDKRLDFVEELLRVVAETNDEGRQALVDAMKLAKRIGQLAPQSKEEVPAVR